MTHRSDRVYLSDDQCRCQATLAACAAKLKCARYLAAIPAHNGSVGDFSLMIAQGLGCTKFYPLIPWPAKAPQPVKPWPTE